MKFASVRVVTASPAERPWRNSYKISVDADPSGGVPFASKFKKFDCCSSIARSSAVFVVPLPP